MSLYPSLYTQKTEQVHLLGLLQYILVIYAKACFAQFLHTQISGGDSILSTTFCGDDIVNIVFCSITYYNITIGNEVTREVHCDIIMGHDVVMDTYHDVTMYNGVAWILIYNLLLCPIMIFLFT